MQTFKTQRKSREAVQETLISRKFAIFYVPATSTRIAIRDEGACRYTTLKEGFGRWSEVGCLFSFAVFNCEFQGFDDLSSFL